MNILKELYGGKISEINRISIATPKKLKEKNLMLMIH